MIIPCPEKPVKPFIGGPPKRYAAGGRLRPKKYSIGDFAEKAFQLFDSDHARVELLCEDAMMSTVLDHFGDKVKTQKVDENHFTITAEVSVSPTFFAWVFEFGGKIKILGPQSVLDAYGELIQKALQ